MEKEKQIIKSEKSNIIRDKKQVKVGIPKEMVEYLKIDSTKDIFLWSIISNEKNEISLEGHLIKGGRLNNEKIEN
jgi:hypothetical protein